MSYRDKYADEIEGLFYDLENRIMLDIVRRIKKEGEITSTADYQIGQLTNLGYSSDEIESRLKKTLNASHGDIWKLYDDVVEQEYTRNKTIYEQINGKFIPYEDNERLQQQIEAAKKQAGGDLENLTKTLGIVESVGGQMTFLPLTEYYRKTLNAAVADIASGAFDYNSVLKRTVNTLANSGIRTIDYKSGYTSRLPVAARRAVLTAVSQLAGEISEMNAEKLGTEYFEVTYHSGARPSHRKWQGRVYTKEELVRICGLGEKTGLKGINCYHDYYPFIPGVSERKYSDKWLREQEKLENKKKTFKGKKYTPYEARQKQRQMETSMRAQRQKVRCLEEGGADPDDVVIAKARYQGQLQEYKRFCNDMELTAQMERVYIDGLGRVASGAKYKVSKTALNSPLVKDTTLAKEGKAFQEVLKESKGSAKHVNKMRLYAEATEYEENVELDVVCSYNKEKDKIEFNPKHEYFSDYDMNFAQAHELSHRMDILEYEAYKNVEFKNAIEEAEECVKENKEEIQKLFEENGKYYNDFAFSDIISALSDNEIIVPVGHISWNEVSKRQEIFANLSSIDVLGSAAAQEPVLQKLFAAYKKVVE